MASAVMQAQASGKAMKGAISQLQEFIQGARSLPMPASCPVLHWSHDTRSTANVEFRATVSFLLDGVPHHTIGAWKPSKKLAQRDVSERVLDLFVGQWGHLLSDESDVSEDSEILPQNRESGSVQARGAAHDLEIYCTSTAASTTGSAPPRWSYVEEAGCYQAFVEIKLFGIPHTFPGKHSHSKESAHDDAARRVLWYFGHPGYENAFEPDLEFAKKVAHDIPKPAACWFQDSALLAA